RRGRRAWVGKATAFRSPKPEPPGPGGEREAAHACDPSADPQDHAAASARDRLHAACIDAAVTRDERSHQILHLDADDTVELPVLVEGEHEAAASPRGEGRAGPGQLALGTHGQRLHAAAIFALADAQVA